MDCLRFIEHGCFTFLLASITSEQEDMRRAGYHCLSRFLSHLEAARLREKSQVKCNHSLFKVYPDSPFFLACVVGGCTQEHYSQRHDEITDCLCCLHSSGSTPLLSSRSHYKHLIDHVMRLFAFCRARDISCCGVCGSPQTIS